MEPIIVLTKGVDYHKNIEMPENTVCRCGGGYWSILNKDTLKLFDESYDFGKYDINLAKEAFEKKRVVYFEEPIFDPQEDWGIKKLVTI